MLSNRPYLMRAFYQWISDSACTPILVIDANNPRCKVPQDYAEGGEIVFNVSATAVRDFNITNQLVEFKAAFSGVVHIISAPINAIIAVYAEENGEGLFFDGSEDDADDVSGEGAVQLKGAAIATLEPSLQPEVSSSQTNGKVKPFLKLVE